MGQTSTLFRAEALRYRTDRLHGAISLATPLAWQAVGFLFLIALAVAVAFLAAGSYARIETVSGAITLDTGVATIVPSRVGVIEALAVSEGLAVRPGTVLARIRSEEDLREGATAPIRIGAALQEQDTQLAAKSSLMLEAARAEQARYRQQITGLGAELVSLDGQAADQQRLLDAAMAESAEVQRVAVNGFISRRDLEARQATVLSRRQQLAQIEQLRAAKRTAIADARSAVVQSRATAQVQVANAQSDRATLVQRRAEVELARGYAITSPVDGVVTALTARVGQAANPQQQLMMIVPSGARHFVELYVPTTAIGFVRPGQSVRLAVDAFPYQQFGTIAAQIADVSGAAIVRPGPNGPVPVYLVTARLDRPWIKAFGRRQPLLPGMTLTARVTTEKRSLLEWLFAPIFAVRNR